MPAGWITAAAFDRDFTGVGLLNMVLSAGCVRVRAAHHQACIAATDAALPLYALALRAACWLKTATTGQG